MSQPENKENTNDENRVTRHRSHKHRRKPKTKKLTFKRFSKWIKRNPSKTIAFFSVGLIIVLTVLFYLYDKEMLTTNEVRSNNINSNHKEPVKGILLPVSLVSESSPVLINFGKITSPVSLEELRGGYTVSPQKLIHCGRGEEIEDRTKFTIYLVEDRLYVTADFRNLLSDEIAGSINQKQWTLLTKSLSGFHSDDNSFQVSDAQGNITFNMQFNQPDSLSIQGYFIGKECVYVVGQNTIYSEAKVGNYIERAMPEIKEVNKLR